MIEPIGRVNVGEKVYEQVLSNILSGEWPSGSRIPSENELAQSFKVSRVPIRETMQRLKALGIVTSNQGKGTFVAQTQPEGILHAMQAMFKSNKKHILDILEYRRLIEPDCAAAAARNAAASDIKRIARYAPAYSQIGNPREDFKELDLEFHREIARAGGNTLIICVNAVIESATRGYLEYSVAQMDLRYAAQCHVGIYEAIASGDQRAAFELMREHLDATIEFVAAYFQE